MSVNYVCRHCRMQIGTIEHEVGETQLGLQSLTAEERKDIITYDQNGDLTLKVVCDYCKEALENNPELTLCASPLQ
jgi:hypothetical protein